MRLRSFPLSCLLSMLLATALITGCQNDYDQEAVIATMRALQTVNAPVPTEVLPTPTAEPTTVPPTPIPTPVGPTPTPETISVQAAPFDGQPLPSEQAALFTTSGNCAICHNSMQDSGGNDVSMPEMWRSTMMANAARDPYWQAEVRAEVLENPELAAVIEDKCATCHMSIARTTIVKQGETGRVLDDGFAGPDNTYHVLAMEGVSCTVCHQIEEALFGQPESFSGHYVIDTDLPTGERLNYGPFSVGQQNATLMQGTSGFIPVQSLHIQASEQCATCHTLFTPFVNAEGEIVGEFPEQTPYLEWLNSDYADAESCQDCHMPVVDVPVQLSATGGPPRESVRQHSFVGGNNYMLSVLRAQGETMGLTTSSEQLDNTISRMEDQLRNRTAELAIDNVALDGSTLSADITVNSLVGHKLPSGIPARRTWLHIMVTDAEGNTVFESGGVRTDGAIEGNDNDGDPAAFEPHYDLITAPEQVQIYEAIMGNTDGEVTTTLLRAAEYLKDNRLLPAGFDVGGASADVAVYGTATGDANFIGGSDTVSLSIEVDAAGPFTIDVELLYQSVAFRWALNLFEYDAVEIETFAAYYDSVPNLPMTITTTSVETGP